MYVCTCIYVVEKAIFFGAVGMQNGLSFLSDHPLGQFESGSRASTGKTGNFFVVKNNK
jgi:hypothetical protein